MLKLSLTIGYVFLFSIYLVGPFIIFLKRIADDAGGKKQLFTTYLLLFLTGAASTVAAFVIERTLGAIFKPDMSSFSGCFFTSFIEAALTEETLKFAALFLFVISSRRFVRYVRGASFAAFVSLGFAFVENLGYVFLSSGSFQTAMARAATSIPGHFVFSIFMGYFFALAVLGQKERENIFTTGGVHYASEQRKTAFYKNLALSFGTAVLSHGVYDFLLMYAGSESQFRALSLVAWLGYLPAAYYAGKYCVDELKAKDAAIREAKRLSENYLYRNRY